LIFEKATHVSLFFFVEALPQNSFSNPVSPPVSPEGEAVGGQALNRIY